MDDMLDELEAELKQALNTITVVRVLKPIQRQVDQCIGLLKTHVDTIAAIVYPKETGAQVDTGVGTAAEGDAKGNGD